MLHSRCKRGRSMCMPELQSCWDNQWKLLAGCLRTDFKRERVILQQPNIGVDAVQGRARERAAQRQRCQEPPCSTVSCRRRLRWYSLLLSPTKAYLKVLKLAKLRCLQEVLIIVFAGTAPCNAFDIGTYSEAQSTQDRRAFTPLASLLGSAPSAESQCHCRCWPTPTACWPAEAAVVGATSTLTSHPDVTPGCSLAGMSAHA